MKAYNLNIAGYIIGFESATGSPELKPSTRFTGFIAKRNGSHQDILINVHKGAYDIPEKAERVFHAPYIEEINGVKILNKDNFWSVWKHGANLFITTIFPLSKPEKKGILAFSLTNRVWDLWVDSTEKEIDPFEYPLDGLILYYISAIYGDIMIHASGVNNLGHGYMFSGESGKGKSTMAGIWSNAGAIIIHDDRLIIRKKDNRYKMFNTPVYENDKPKDSALEKIFIIDHGTKNRMVPVNGADAITTIMANCIHHGWNKDIIARLMGSISMMCRTVNVTRLFFKPDRSVIDHILENE